MPQLWAPDQLEHLGACPVCRATARRLAYAGLTDKLFHCSGDAWSIYACAGCGTHYLDPRPTKDSIGLAYADYPTHASTQDAAPAAATGSLVDRTRRVLRALANGYRNARWGTQLEPRLSWGRYVVPFIPLLRDAIVQQMRSLPPRPTRPGARLLDVGCGSGDFLELARSAGWSVQGCDFDPMAVATAQRRGLDVRQGGLEILQAAAPDSFDWVTLSHVLEHVHEQHLWLQQLHRVLRPGGGLWLQTPNVDSIGHARYRENWRGLEPPRHLALWTFETLRDTLRQVGFRSVRPLPTAVVTAMEVYASSEALSAGLDDAAFGRWPRARQRPLRSLWPALRQHWSTRRSEFHTVLAVK